MPFIKSVWWKDNFSRMTILEERNWSGGYEEESGTEDGKHHETKFYGYPSSAQNFVTEITQTTNHLFPKSHDSCVSCSANPVLKKSSSMHSGSYLLIVSSASISCVVFQPLLGCFATCPTKVVMNSVSTVSRKGHSHWYSTCAWNPGSIPISYSKLDHLLCSIEPQCHHLQDGGNGTYLVVFL